MRTQELNSEQRRAMFRSNSTKGDGSTAAGHTGEISRGGGTGFDPTGSYNGDSIEYDETPDRVRLLDGDGPAGGRHEFGVATPHRSDSTTLHAAIASALMRHLGQAYATLTALGLLTSIVLLSTDAAREYHDRPDFAAFYSAAVVVIVTVVMSTRQIYRQLTNWFMPDVQKYVVRILWMVPVYAVQSWCSLRFHGSRIYIDTVRDLYEAFVIQSFLYYLVELLGGEDALIMKLRAKASHYGEHQGGMDFFFRTWDMGTEFMLNCKYGVLQYVVAKTFCAIATVILEEFDLYGEGTYNFGKGYVYLSFIINISQCWALYCLIKFYHATADDLRSPKNWHPLGKFLCVKGVVFFTWWQSMGIFFLRSQGIIGDLGNWDADDVANGIQDYLICLEMLGFAIAHAFTFTEEEYLPSGGRRGDGAGTAYRGVSGGGIGTDGPSGGGDEDSDDGEYRPPTIRTLHAPMGIRDAFWSSTVPTEALEDIRRLRKGVSSEVMSLTNDPGMISLASLQNAESI